MKQLVLTALAFSMAAIATAQFKRIVVEEVANRGLVKGTTYRVYAELSHAQDHVHAIFGDKENVLNIECTKPFFQHPDGGALSRDIQRKAVAEDESLAFDSWMTIGLEDNYVNQVAQFMLDDGLMQFEEGNGFSSNDGTWYATPDAAQVFPVANRRVLLMQLTTEGKVTATVNLQGRTVGVSESGERLENGAAKQAEQDRLRAEIEALKTQSDAAKGADKKALDAELERKREAFRKTNGEIWKQTGINFTCG